MTQHDLGSRGHDETRDSSNRRNVMPLVSLIANYDDYLKNSLEQLSVFPLQIQTDLSSTVATIIIKSIKQEFGEARLIARCWTKPLILVILTN